MISRVDSDEVTKLNLGGLRGKVVYHRRITQLGREFILNLRGSK